MYVRIRREQLSKILHLVQALFVVGDASLKQQPRYPVLHLHHLFHQEMAITHRSASIPDLSRYHVALGKEVTAQAVREGSRCSARSPRCTAAAISAGRNRSQDPLAQRKS